MSQSTVIRKRSDYREPCSTDIQDYDKYLMNLVINKTKCIPPYWKEINQDIPGFMVCTFQEQLQLVYENISDNQLSFFGECIPHILKLISVLWRETFRNEANNVINYPAWAKYRFIKGDSR